MSTSPPAITERLVEFGQALVLLALPAAGAWGVRRARAARRRRRCDTERAVATADGVRISLDCLRAVLDRMTADASGIAFVSDDWLGRLAVLRSRVDDSRNRLWMAIGYPNPREVQLSASERKVMAELSRTLRLRARDMDPDEREAWLEEQRVAMRRAAGLADEETPMFKDQG